MYFEDFAAGQQFVSPARTIGEADITLFSMLSGDWNALHSDEIFAGRSRFGARIAHGALGIAIATGLLTRLGIFEGSALALLDFREWQFSAPIFVGDTLHLDLQISATRAGKDGGKGVVDRRLRLIKQDGSIVQQGWSAVLVAAGPGAQAQARRR